MPTTKKRLNLSLTKELETALAKLAKRDELPTATKALHLLKLAMEIEEDQVWSELAATRDSKSARFVSHKKVWG